MRKILMMLLVLAMTVCGVIGIAACDKEPDPEQNQGQVEQEKDKDKDKDKDKEEVNPGQSQGGNEEEEGKGDEEDGKPSDGKEPQTPEEQKPNPENPPKDEDPKEEDPKEDEKDPQPSEDEEPENPGEEEPNPPDGDPDDEPQGDDPSAGDPDDDGPSADDPDKKPDPQPEPQPEPKPDQENCEHEWKYEAYGTDRNARQHVATCTKCTKKLPAEKCTFDGTYTTVSATCTEDGYDAYYCTVCKIACNSYGYTPKNGNKYPKTGHEMESTWTHIDGTENKTSQHERKCIHDGCTYVEVKNCEFDGEVIAPTCEQKGTDNRTCKDCGCKPSETSLEQLDHIWEYRESKNGETHEKYCTRDCCSNKPGIEEQCTYQVTASTEGSCTEKGTTTSVCSVCHHKKVEENISSFGHKFTKWNFCDVCGYDGIKCEYGGMKGGYHLNRIVYNDELKNVKKIIIASSYDGVGNVQGIENGAFSGFSNLEEIFIPGGIYSIGVDAFNGTKLNTIYFGGNETSWNRVTPDGSVRGSFKEKFTSPTGTEVSMQYNQDGDELKEKWNTTTVALPAADTKRLYA